MCRLFYRGFIEQRAPDLGIRWALVTQARLSIELVMSLCVVTSRSSSAWFAFCGLLSSLLSVYRVWIFGR